LDANILIKQKEEKMLIEKCIQTKTSILEAKIAGILWKRDGVNAGLLFLDSMQNHGCAILT